MKIWLFISILLLQTNLNSGADNTAKKIERNIKPPFRYTFAIPKQYNKIVYNAANENNIPVWILARLLERESKWNPNETNKNPNESIDLGIAQFNSTYLSDYIWFDNYGAKFDPFNPEEAIPVAARYLKRLYKVTKSWDLAVLAYNAGLSRIYDPPQTSINHMNEIMKKY